MRTGEADVDTLLASVLASADNLRNHVAELSPMERISVEQATGSYLPALLDSYLRMPHGYRTDRELPTGGTAHDAMVRSLTLLSALLRHAEERVNGFSAATIAVAAASIEQQYATAVACGDIAPLPPPRRRLDWRSVLNRYPLPVVLGVVGVLVTGLVVAAILYPLVVVAPAVGATVLYFATGRR